MKVYELLSDRSKWCRGALVKGSTDEPLASENDPLACSWCALGALYKCYGRGDEGALVIDLVYRALGDTPLTSFNDSAPYEEVIKLFRNLDI